MQYCECYSQAALSRMNQYTAESEESIEKTVAHGPTSKKPPIECEKHFFLGLNVECVENFAICITRVVTFRVRSLAWYIQGLAYEGAKRGCPEEAKDPVKAAKCFKIAANLVC